MAPIGPRLDRPSAVGDEGRPRATSLFVATVVVIGTALAVGSALGERDFFAGFALLVGLSVAGMASLDRDRVRQTVVGHLCFLPATSFLVVLVALSAESALIAVGTVATLAGVGSAWADVAERDDVRRTLVSSLISYAFGLVGLVVAGVLLLVMVLLLELVTGLGEGADPAGSLLGLLVVLGVVCACLCVAVWVLPVEQLAPRHRETEAEQRVGRILRRLFVGTVGSFALAAYGGMLALADVLQPVTTVWPVPGIIDALTSTVVIAPLVGIALMACAVTILTVGTRKITADYDPTATRFVAAALAACGYLVALAILGLSVGMLGGVALLVLIFAAVLIPLAVYAGLLVLFVALRLGVVSDRAAPMAVTATGLVCVAIGGATAGLSPLIVFLSVAGALVVWDVGTFGLGVTAELGHIPETRRLELYHGVFAVIVGIVAVTVATGLEAQRRAIAAGIGAPEAMAVAAIGVVILLIPLRG